jgi:hypothetical protein
MFWSDAIDSDGKLIELEHDSVAFSPPYGFHVRASWTRVEFALVARPTRASAAVLPSIGSATISSPSRDRCSGAWLSTISVEALCMLSISPRNSDISGGKSRRGRLG